MKFVTHWSSSRLPANEGLRDPLEVRRALDPAGELHGPEREQERVLRVRGLLDVALDRGRGLLGERGQLALAGGLGRLGRLRLEVGRLGLELLAAELHVGERLDVAGLPRHLDRAAADERRVRALVGALLGHLRERAGLGRVRQERALGLDRVDAHRLEGVVDERQVVVEALLVRGAPGGVVALVQDDGAELRPGQCDGGERRAAPLARGLDLGRVLLRALGPDRLLVVLVAQALAGLRASGSPSTTSSRASIATTARLPALRWSASTPVGAGARIGAGGAGAAASSSRSACSGTGRP